MAELRRSFYGLCFRRNSPLKGRQALSIGISSKYFVVAASESTGAIYLVYIVSRFRRLTLREMAEDPPQFGDEGDGSFEEYISSLLLETDFERKKHDLLPAPQLQRLTTRQWISAALGKGPDDISLLLLVPRRTMDSF